MHKFFTRTLAASAMTIAFAGALFAAQATPPATGSTQTTPKSSTHKGTKSTTASASHSATGTIEKFDAASNTLTVKTASGDENFMLGTAAKLNHGSKALKAEDLSNMTGDKVKVHYTEANGTKTATSVMVSSAKSTSKAPTKSEPKK
jgi:Cu/Ag efflux protein CusF